MNIFLSDGLPHSDKVHLPGVQFSTPLFIETCFKEGPDTITQIDIVDEYDVEHKDM